MIIYCLPSFCLKGIICSFCESVKNGVSYLTKTAFSYSILTIRDTDKGYILHGSVFILLLFCDKSIFITLLFCDKCTLSKLLFCERNG